MTVLGAARPLTGMFYDKGGASFNGQHPDFSGGAKPDREVVTDGAITTGTATLTSATGAFAAADVGKTILVYGAGAAGAALLTTILAYVNATTVTLATNASTTVSGKKVVWGTDNTAALTAWITAIPAYCEGWLPGGAYLVNGQLTGLKNGVRLHLGKAVLTQVGAFKATIYIDTLVDAEVEGGIAEGRGTEHNGAATNYNGVAFIYCYGNCADLRFHHFTARNHAGGVVRWGFGTMQSLTVDHFKIVGIGLGGGIVAGDNNDDVGVGSYNSLGDYDINLHDGEISETCFAVFLARGSGAKIDLNIHDIRGQHGGYLSQMSKVSVKGQIRNCAYIGFKNQIPSDAKTVANGAITTGTPTLTSATAGFVAGDAGKTISVSGAGAAGALLTTTILAYVNSTTVTLAVNASTTVSGATVIWGTPATADQVDYGPLTVSGCGQTGVDASVVTLQIGCFFDRVTYNDVHVFDCGTYGFSGDTIKRLTMKGCTVDGAGAYGFNMNRVAGQMDNCTARNTSWTGLFGTLIGDLTLTNCKFIDTVLNTEAGADNNRYRYIVQLIRDALALVANPVFRASGNIFRFSSGVAEPTIFTGANGRVIRLGTGVFSYIDESVKQNYTTRTYLFDTTSDCKVWRRPSMSADVGNASKTVTSITEETLIWDTALSGARTCTMPAASPDNAGIRWRIVRTANATGAVNLTIQDSGAVLITALAGPSLWAEVESNGTILRLVGRGPLV